MSQNTEQYRLYGLMAEFDNSDDLLSAAEGAHSAGYRQMDAYSPMPIHGLAEALGFRKPKLPLLVLLGGITGAVCGYGLQYYTSVIDYPINIGGRPLHSWPAFIPVTFELTILFAAFAAVFGMLALNGLPMPYHPVFNLESFKRATRDRFFLCIETKDEQFDLEETRAFLEGQKPIEVSEVEE
jgi:hypothetical protein